MQFRWLFWLVVSIIILFLIIPVLIIIPMSFGSGRYLEFPPASFSLQWYETFFTSVDWKASALVSLQVAFFTTILSMFLGVPASFAIVRGNFPFKRFLTAFFSLPIVFPIIVSAVSLYYVFAPLHLISSRIGLVLAHTILALPVVILPVAGALRRFDRYLEWQALNLGASRIRTLVTVTLPLLRPVLFTVGLFAFITSFDEIIFAIFFSGGSTVTLPKKIWEGLRFEIQPTVAVVATFMIVFSTAVMVSAIIMNRRFRFLRNS